MVVYSYGGCSLSVKQGPDCTHLIFRCTESFYSHIYTTCTFIQLVHCKQALYEETIQGKSLGL